MNIAVRFGTKKLYRIPYRSTQYKTGRVQAPTFTASSHTQHYDVIWMLIEEDSTLFNYILSLPMLL
jgi:hypothetical protein